MQRACPRRALRTSRPTLDGSVRVPDTEESTLACQQGRALRIWSVTRRFYSVTRRFRSVTNTGRLLRRRWAGRDAGPRHYDHPARRAPRAGTGPAPPLVSSARQTRALVPGRHLGEGSRRGG